MFGGWIFAIAAGAFGYQVHGWFGAVVAALAVPILTIPANYLYMAKLLNSDDSEDSERDVIADLQKIKWGVFILVMVIIALSGAEYISL